MTLPGAPASPHQDIPVPLQSFFRRLHDVAIAALRTIPYVGDSVSEFVDRSIYPVLAPRRDRAVGFLFRSFRTLEGRLQAALLRLLPMPPPLPSRDRESLPR